MSRLLGLQGQRIPKVRCSSLISFNCDHVDLLPFDSGVKCHSRNRAKENDKKTMEMMKMETKMTMKRVMTRMVDPPQSEPVAFWLCACPLCFLDRYPRRMDGFRSLPPYAAVAIAFHVVCCFYLAIVQSSLSYPTLKI